MKIGNWMLCIVNCDCLSKVLKNFYYQANSHPAKSEAFEEERREEDN